MPTFNVSQLVQDVSRKVSPANPTDSKDILGAVYNAARNVTDAVTLKDLSRRGQIENAIYDDVFRFSCPEDLDENNVMQLFKYNQAGRNTDTFYYPMLQRTNRRFDQHRVNDRNLFTIEYQSGVKFIKLTNYTDSGRQLIHDMNTITDNGTWNTFGNVVNLTTDNLNYVSGTGSLRFDINNSSNTGGLDNFTLTPFNLSDYFVTGKIFGWLDVPNLNQFQTVTLELFSSNTDYYSITVSQPHDATAFQIGWNLLGFMFDPKNMTTVGTPNPAALNHIRITFVTNGTLLMNNVRMDNIIARQGLAVGIQYASEYLFNDVQTGLWKARPTDGSDIIHVEASAYNLLLDETAVVVGQELFTGKQSQVDLARLEKMRDDGMRMYKKRHKSEIIQEQQLPYQWGVPYGYWNGSGWNDRQSRPPGWWE